MPGGYEWIIIVAVLLLLFGAKKLPDMARSVGQSARVFKGEMKGLKDDEKKSDPAPKADDAPSSTPQALPTSTPDAGTGTPATGSSSASAPSAGTAPTESTPQAQPSRGHDAT